MVLAAGQNVKITGICFPANSSQTIVLHSDPVTLGVVQTNGGGNFVATFVIPTGTSPGTHTITGGPGGTVLASATITVTGNHIGVTGSNSTRLLFFALALAFAGAVLLAGKVLGDDNDSWAERL